jgi:hypothetical protein
MHRPLGDIRATLIEGLKRTGQGSYQRRQPSESSLPLLRESRRELAAFVAASPDNAEAWRLLSLAHEAVLAYDDACTALERALAIDSRPTNKDIKRLAMLEEIRTEWAELGLTPDELRTLVEHVDSALCTTPCDHTPRFTTAWLQVHRPAELARLLRALENRGGYCDCEVAMNAG